MKKWGELVSTTDQKIETVYKVQEPLMPVEGGHGYAGVLLRDTNNDSLQCHICGTWSSCLARHLKVHKITADMYRDKFELPIHCPLLSNSTLSKFSLRASSLKNLERLKKIRRPHMAYKKRTRKMWKRAYGLAHDNKHGLCPEQLMRRFLIVADKVGNEPKQNDLIKHDHSLFAGIRQRYGSLNKFRKKHSFTVVKRAPIFTDDHLLALIQKYKYEYGQVPSQRQFENTMKISANTVRKHFGSWNKACVLSAVI